MYKRRARILLLSRDESALKLACEVLPKSAGEFLQGRCVRYESVSGLREDLEWADLLLTWERTVWDALQRESIALPMRCWQLPEGEETQRQFLLDGFASMAAGMRMMQRMEG